MNSHGFLDSNTMSKLFKLLALAFAAIVLVATTSNYWTNYSNSDGIVLPNGELVGGDFICFYVAGQSARFDIDGLYDYEKGYDAQRRIVDGSTVLKGYLPFAYPPLVALPFAALSSLPFQWAYLGWLALSSLLCGLSVLLILHHSTLSKATKFPFFVFSFSFVPFLINCLGGGQTSCIGLFAYALVFFLLKSDRDFLAGIALALSYYKPPLFLLFVVFVLMHRRWKMLTTFCLTALLLIAGSIAMTGFNGFVEYLRQVSQYTYGQEIFRGVTLPPHLGVGFHALLTMTIKSTPLIAKLLFWLAAAVLIFAAYYAYIRKRKEERQSELFNLTFALEVTASAFMSLQLLYYDLTILLFPILIVGAHLSKISFQKLSILLLIPIVGLYTEFLYRQQLAAVIPIKAVTVFMLMWIVGLFLAVSRQKVLGLESSQ